MREEAAVSGGWGGQFSFSFGFGFVFGLFSGGIRLCCTNHTNQLVIITVID